MKFSIARVLVVALAAETAVASSWFTRAPYNKWHETELERWLSDHDVPYPTPADRKDLQNIVKENWQSAIESPYAKWDTERLQSYLTSKGQQVKKGTEQNKDELLAQVKSAWHDADATAHSTYDDVVTWIFNTWSDSALKSFCDSHGIPVPQPRTRDQVLSAARENYQSVATKAGETAAYPGNWLYEAWTDSDLKKWLDEHGVTIPASTNREKLLAAVRRNSYLARNSLSDTASSLSGAATDSASSLSGAATDSASSLSGKYAPSASSLYGKGAASASSLSGQGAASVSSLSKGAAASASSASKAAAASASSLSKVAAASASSLSKGAAASASSLSKEGVASASSLSKGAAASLSSLANKGAASAASAYTAVSQKAGASASSASQAVSDALFESWSDSQLKEWADKNGIKVPQGSKRNEILAVVRKQAAKLSGDNVSASAASAYGAATSRAGNEFAKASDDAALKANGVAAQASSYAYYYYTEAKIALGFQTNYVSSASATASSVYAKASSAVKNEL